MQNEEMNFDPDECSLFDDEEITIRGLKLALLVDKEEIQSLKNHYKTSKNDVLQLEMRNQAIWKRMDILNGMLEKAYHQITVLNDTVSGYKKAIFDDVTEAKRLREENENLKKLRHCINCYYGNIFPYNEKDYCKDCFNCSKWELG